MRQHTAKKHSTASQKLKVVAVNASEQTRRVQEAVARRAYEIFENRGSASWHELEDWHQAESELVRPRCSGQMGIDGTLWVGIEATTFDEGAIEIWVAPRQLTICGKPRAAKLGAATNRSESCSDKEAIFHVVELTCEVDPSRVTATINGPSLEIQLRKAEAEPETTREVKEAVA
jgi:hypothetical protein